MYLRAMQIAGRLDDRGERQEFAAAICHNFAGLAHSRGRHGEALKFARRGIQARKRIRPHDAVALAADEAACAAILAEIGRYSGAVKMLQGALRIFRRKLGPRHYEVGAALANLGAIYWKMSRADAAEKTLRDALVILESALGKRHPRTIGPRANLAYILRRRAALSQNRLRTLRT